MSKTIYCLGICLEGLRKMEKDLRIADVPAGVKNQNLPNTNASQKRCHTESVNDVNSISYKTYY
jgi:hypothetical protein